MPKVNTKQNKKIVVFDLLGVITEESMFATKIIYPLIKKAISYDLFKKKYLLYAIRNISRKDFWKYICSEKEIDKLEEKIIDKTKITVGTKDVMSFLLKNNCDLYLATEIPKAWGEKILEKAGIDDIFKMKFYSSDLKATKPLPAFYEKVFNKTNSSEIFYVDDVDVNLLAAKEIRNIRTIFYNAKSRLIADKRIDYKINSINSLKKIICSQAE